MGAVAATGAGGVFGATGALCGDGSGEHALKAYQAMHATAARDGNVKFVCVI